MQKNIIELAKEEAITYLKNLDTSRTFKQIVDRYIKLHNKGIFINFRFNSSDATGLFGSFSHFYNFKIDSHINPEFRRDRVLLFGNLEKKQRNKINMYEKELEQIRSIENRFRESSRHFELNLKDVSVPTDITKEYLLDTYRNNEFLNFTSAAISLRKKNARDNEKTSRNLISLVNKLERDMRYVESELKHIELQYFKLVLKKYFDSIGLYAAQLFSVPKAIAIYREKEWLKFYTEKRDRTLNYYSSDVNLSNFESFIIQIIEDNIDKFSLKLFDDKYVYSVSNSHTSVDLLHKPKNNIETKIEELNNAYREFVNQYPEFVVAVRTINDTAQKLDSQDHLLLNILSFIRQHYPGEIFEEYNNIVCKIQEAEKEKYSPESYPNLPDFYASFSNLTFDIKKEKDLAYWYALKEERYNDVIQSITNKSYILPLTKNVEVLI